MANSARNHQFSQLGVIGYTITYDNYHGSEGKSMTAFISEIWRSRRSYEPLAGGARCKGRPLESQAAKELSYGQLVDLVTRL